MENRAIRISDFHIILTLDLLLSVYTYIMSRNGLRMYVKSEIRLNVSKWLHFGLKIGSKNDQLCRLYDEIACSSFIKTKLRLAHIHIYALKQTALFIKHHYSYALQNENEHIHSLLLNEPNCLQLQKRTINVMT